MSKKIEDNTFKSIIGRRQMLRTSIIAAVGTIVSAPAIVTARSPLIVPTSESMIVVPGGWSFLKRMFDFKNRFWQIVGAVLQAVLNVQQYPQILPYNQNQSYAGYQVPQASPILEIPQQNQTYSLTNSYPTSYQEVIAGNQNGQRSIFSLPPAGLIALKEASEAIMKKCPCISTEDLRNLLVPQNVIEQSKPQTLNGQYYGKYQTRYGTLELSQTPAQGSQADLFFRLKNKWNPDDIITPKRPMGVLYLENDVITR